MKIYPSFSKITERDALEDGDIPLGYISTNNLTPEVKIEQVNGLSPSGDTKQVLTPYTIVDTSNELLFDMNGEEITSNRYTEKTDGVEYVKAGIVKEFSPETFSIKVNLKRDEYYRNNDILPLKVGVVESASNDIAKSLVAVTGDGARRGLLPPALRINGEDTSYTSFYDMDMRDLDILIIESHDGVHYAGSNEVIDIDAYVSAGINVWLSVKEMEGAMLPISETEDRYTNPPYPERYEEPTTIDYRASMAENLDRDIQVSKDNFDIAIIVDDSKEIGSDDYMKGFGDGYQYGYEKGFKTKHALGFKEGHVGGYSRGAMDGEALGSAEGKEVGFEFGYDKGFTDYTNGNGHSGGNIQDYEKVPQYEDLFASEKAPEYEIVVTPYAVKRSNPLTADELSEDGSSELSEDYIRGVEAGYKEGVIAGEEAGYNSGYGLAYNISYEIAKKYFYFISYVRAKEQEFSIGYEAGYEIAQEKNEVDPVSFNMTSPLYYKQDRITYEDMNFLWSPQNIISSYGWAESYEPIFLFDSYSPIAVLEKQNAGHVVFFEHSVLTNAMKYRLVIAEMLLFIALKGYKKYSKDNLWITDERVGYKYNTSNVLGDTQDRLRISDVMPNQNYYQETFETDNSNVVFDEIIDNIVRFKKVQATDPAPENYPSIYTHNKTIVYYEPSLQRIETKLDYDVREMASSISISFAPIKSSSLKLNIPRHVASVPKQDGSYFACATKKSIEVKTKQELSSEDLPLLRIDVSSKAETKLFDASIPGGGLPLKAADNYNVMDIASMEGRPFRKASGVIITLPQSLRPFHDRIVKEVNKHKATAEVVKIKYE